MKLISFTHQGQRSFGAIANGGVVDLRARLGLQSPDLKDFLAQDLLAKARDLLARAEPDVALAAVELLPVIPQPGKIWCCGLNYYEHVEECGAKPSTKPMFFLRYADSQVAHMQPILRPRESQQLDFEGELAVVIGRPGRRIAEGDVAQHIAGYACYNDGSVRDWQLHSSQWDSGKNFWRTGGFGPWMVTADEIDFGTPLDIVTRLNGVEVQRSSTKLMIHDIASQIAYLSTIAPLQTGDVIVTGTPGGIGAKRVPPLWMKAGDMVEVEIERIGTLRNPVADD